MNNEKLEEKVQLAQRYNKDISLERMYFLYEAHLNEYGGLFPHWTRQEREKRADAMVDSYLSYMTGGLYRP